MLAGPVVDSQSATHDNTLDRVRRLCLALPETNERLSHGMPTYFVRDQKTFVIFHGNHDGGRPAIWCHAPHGVQPALIEQDPAQFFQPPYVGPRGWIGVRLDRNVDWEMVADLIEDAYAMVAPKRLLAELTAREQERPR